MGYNGFTGPERKKGGALQTWAYSRGYLVRPENCTACRIRGVVPGEIIAHLEDYTEPIKGAIFLCYRCHRMVHLRAEWPEDWLDYITAVRNGYAWPLTRSRREVASQHLGTLDPLMNARKLNRRRDRTVLDDIHEGLLHPGPRSEWGDRMELIMQGKRAFWVPGSQDRLFDPV
jgi:hypothetical protein